MTPDYKEATISQIPAIRLLQQLGFSYLSPEEAAVERTGRLGRVVLEDVLTSQLRRLNKNDGSYAMTQVRDGKAKEGPDILKDRDLSRALFGALKNELGRESTSSVVREDPVTYGSPADNAARLEQVLAEAACGMEDNRE